MKRTQTFTDLCSFIFFKKMQAQDHLNLTEFKIHIENNKKACNKETPIDIKSRFYNNEEFDCSLVLLD